MATRRKKKNNHPVRDYGLAILSAIALAFSIRFLLVEAYRMPSRAMIPTVEAGDTLFVSKIAYGLRIPFTRKRLGGGKMPQVGDVIVLEFPEEPGREYIKRVVARGGDRVQLKGGHVIVNGEDRTRGPEAGRLCGTEVASLAKTYAVCWEPPLLDDLAETRLDEGELFVIGDLRSKGADTTKRLKLHGKVTLADIRGKATTIWLSVNSAKDQSGSGGWFSRIRFDRLFQRIE